MADFVTVDITTDPTQLLDDAIDQMNSTLEANGFPGWTAQDADLAVILLGVIAQIAADVAQVAATVVPAIFRAFGTQLLGVAYQNGARASVLSTWTFTSPAPTGGYTIEAGITVIIDSQAFYVQNTYTSGTGDLSASILLAASDPGSAFNNLGGVSVGSPRVQLNSQIDWVSSVVTAGVTSGGADQQSDDDYGTALVNEIALRAPRPLVTQDFAGMLLSEHCFQATGIVVGRATSIDGYYPLARTLSVGGTGPAPLTCVATFSNASTAVTINSALELGSIPDVGATVTGTGIAAGTTVAASPAPTASSFTLSANSTAAESGVSLTISSWQSVALANTSFVTDTAGNALTAAQMDSLQAWLGTYRAGNWLVYVTLPSYALIYVTVSIHALPNYAPTAVASQVQSAILAYINPLSWGSSPSTSGQSGWLNSSSGFSTVRANKLIGLVEAVPGVDYVPSGGLTLGFSASPAGTTDLLLGGPAPLPQSTSASIVVNTV